MENSTPTKKSAKDDQFTQYELAIRILAHYRERSSGRGVQWNMINMPGRNLKSMQNMFTKINEDIKSLGIEASPATVAGDAPAAAGKKRARGPGKPKKTKSSSETGEGESDDQDLDTPSKPPPKKRVVKTEPLSDEFIVDEDIKAEVKEFEQGLIKSDIAQFNADSEI